MKNIRRALTMLLCVAMVISMAACGSKPEATKDSGDQQKSTKDTINIAVSGDNGTLLPCKVLGTFVGIVRQYSETLIDFTTDGEMVYGLATGIENDDTNEWTIHLREGVKFNNGNTFDANDLLFTVQYYMNDPTLSLQFVCIDVANCAVIDQYTFKLALGYYNAMLMGSLSQMYMMDAESFNEDAMVTNPIGTGPYVVKDYVVNSHVDLVANEDYWGNKATIKNLHYKILNEESQIVNALETGSVDVASVPTQDIELVKGFEDYTTLSYSAMWAATMEFNITKDSIMNDVNARRAVCHAIDREAIANLVYFGSAEVLDFPVSEHTHDYTDDLANMDDTYSIGYDLDLAKEYAEKAGLVGQTITVITNGQSTYVTEAEMIQLNLEKIGVTVKIVNYDTASYWSVAYDPTMFDISLYAASSPQGYAVGLLYEYVMWAEATKSGWDKFGEYCALGAEAVGNSDPESRKSMLKDLAAMFEEAIPWYGLCDTLSTVAINKDLAGVQIWNSGIMHYADWSWTA